MTRSDFVLIDLVFKPLSPLSTSSFSILEYTSTLAVFHPPESKTNAAFIHCQYLCAAKIVTVPSTQAIKWSSQQSGTNR